MEGGKETVKEAARTEANGNEVKSNEVKSNEVKSKEGGGREAGATRRTAAEIAKKTGHAVWIDPFADDGEAPAGTAADRGASGRGAERSLGRGVDSVGSLTSSPSASRPTSGPRPTSASRALTTRGPRWVDPFAE
jgi:hypothetical protein